MTDAYLLETRVRVWDDIDALHTHGYCGKIIETETDRYLELSLVEAMHLVEKGMLSVVVNSEKQSQHDLSVTFTEKDSEFPQQLAVYRDLRSRGYVVKSGFKFGTHFRVYPRGVNPYKDGPKSQKEHTKWVVHAVPEEYRLSYQEMSRAVRLAQNIRTTLLWAVVDNEQGVTYYEFERIRP